VSLLYADETIASLTAIWLLLFLLPPQDVYGLGVVRRSQTGLAICATLGVAICGPAASLSYFCLKSWPRRGFLRGRMIYPQPAVERMCKLLFVCATAAPFVLGWSWIYDHGHYCSLDTFAETLNWRIDNVRTKGHHLVALDNAILIPLALLCNFCIFSTGASGNWILVFVAIQYSTPSAAVLIAVYSTVASWRNRNNWFFELNVMAKFRKAVLKVSLALSFAQRAYQGVKKLPVASTLLAVEETRTAHLTVSATAYGATLR